MLGLELSEKHFHEKLESSYTEVKRVGINDHPVSVTQNWVRVVSFRPPLLANFIAEVESLPDVRALAKT